MSTEQSGRSAPGAGLRATMAQGVVSLTGVVGQDAPTPQCSRSLSSLEHEVAIAIRISAAAIPTSLRTGKGCPKRTELSTVPIGSLALFARCRFDLRSIEWSTIKLNRRPGKNERSNVCSWWG